MSDTVTLPRRAAAAARARFADTLAALARDLIGAWRLALARSGERRRNRSEHEWIDTRTLRDLGIGRAELSSFRAEALGLAEPSRLRVLRDLERWP